MGKLVILAGPSCVGKSPLEKALKRLYPEVHSQLQPLILYNSRAPRPGETDGKDYHFRSRAYISDLKSDKRYVVMDVRGDLQALDVEQLLSDLEESDLLFEGNPFVGKSLLEHSQLTDIPKVSAFMSPLSREEIEHLKNTDPPAELPALVTDVMRRKLLRRTRKQKGELSIKDLENIEKRAGSAFTEMQDAHLFDHVIPNHDGEDSENWDAFYHPLGDARKSLQAFVLLLEGKTTSLVEDWGKDLLNQ